MTWDPLQQPPDGQGPYVEYGPYNPPQAPYLLYGPPGTEQQAGTGAGANTAPLSLWEAIKQLPGQYWRVLTKPGAATFAEEMGKARWDVIWVQLFGYALIGSILAALAVLILVNLLLGPLFSTLPDAGGQGFLLGFSLVYAVILGVSIFTGIVGGFFLGQGITYLLARLFGGRGDFMAQAYTALLFQAPIGLISSTIGLIPFIGSLVGSAAGIYGYVLQVFSLMAVHRLSGGKATAVVLIPVATAIVLSIGAYIVFLLFLFSTFNNLPAPTPTP